MAMSLDEFCSRLANLRLDRSGGRVKPYKPLLVAAVVILIHKGKQRSRNLFLDGGLRSAFQQLLDILFPGWPYAAKPEYPFRHLENDGVWTLVAIEGASEALRAAKSAHAEAWDVLRHVRCAQLDEAVFQRLATSFDLVVGQVSRYLGWIAEERRGHRESAVGAIIVRKADPKLRYAVKANDRLSLWEFDEQLEVRLVA